MRDHRPDVRLDTSLETLLEHGLPGGDGAVLATLVSTSGSTYRKPGARMLIQADGRYLGLLSGGCLESDLKMHAREVAVSGTPRAVEYDMRGPDDILFGLGAGCEGAMRILLEPASAGTLAATSLGSAGRATLAGLPATLVAVHESNHVALGTYDLAALESPAPSATVSVPTTQSLAAAAREALRARESRQIQVATGAELARAYVQFLAPPPHIVICGGGPDAAPVVSAARSLGWRVSVLDHRPAYALAERFPGARVHCAAPQDLRSTIDLGACHAVVVMSHHLPSDVAYLRELAAATEPQYVGLLGPAARRRRIAHELGSCMRDLRPRIRGPVGLNIGAVTPEGIGIAIVCQIHAWLAGREGQMLDSQW